MNKSFKIITFTFPERLLLIFIKTADLYPEHAKFYKIWNLEICNLIKIGN